MHHVYSQGKHVAMINHQHKLSDGYNKETPWLLLHNTGRVDRFPSFTEARQEAIKSWAAATLKRS